MKSLLYASLLFICTAISACVDVGSATFPEPTANYQPKKVYNASIDTLWNAVEAVLESQRVNIASSDKSDGRITTDYIQGPTQMNLVPGMPDITTRYKYAITIKSVDQSQSKLTIICTLESSSESMAWHDVSKDNAERVTGLENWLYERIDKSLPSH
ncbi:MAG TPA: outer membrane protein assembly factor BamC [Candidatus Acidoferrales bacterium]|nr:outer membrane protein assembly factor BamC [Candidatus Acidoferrales bacterium]